MPNLYGNFHDQFLENYLNKNEFTYFKEERHLFIIRKYYNKQNKNNFFNQINAKYFNKLMYNAFV